MDGWRGECGGRGDGCRGEGRIVGEVDEEVHVQSAVDLELALRSPIWRVRNARAAMGCRRVPGLLYSYNTARPLPSVNHHACQFRAARYYPPVSGL